MLSYLNSLEKDDYMALSKDQYEKSNNMTDTFSALKSVVSSDNKMKKMSYFLIFILNGKVTN